MSIKNGNRKVITAAVLENRIADTRRRVTDCERQMEALRTEHTILAGELRGLEGLLEYAVEVEVGHVQNGHAGDAEQEDETPGPRSACLAFIRSHPGLMPGKIVDALIGEVRTDAKNVRRTLLSTLWTLRKNGDIEAVPDGQSFRLFPKGGSREGGSA